MENLYNKKTFNNGDTLEVRYNGRSRGIPSKDIFVWRFVFNGSGNLKGTEYRAPGRWTVESIAKWLIETLYSSWTVTKEDRPEMLSEGGFINKARKLVQEEFYSLETQRLELDDIYVVWFCKTLQNWKALVSTNAKDNRYYEVTYDGEHRRSFIDAYSKVENITVHDTPGI